MVHVMGVQREVVHISWWVCRDGSHLVYVQRGDIISVCGVQRGVIHDIWCAERGDT